MTDLARILERLERAYGEQQARWPTDPYHFLLWWQCGYPPSEQRCARGWDKLRQDIGLTPQQLAAARVSQLTRVLKAGGMVPQLRAKRLRAIAQTVSEEFGADLAATLRRLPLAQARRVLKRFPGIGDPGADRILLFAGLAPIAAVPSACPHVPVRLVSGAEPQRYTAIYTQARQLIESQLPATPATLTRAYLLLQRHGSELCKRTHPQCALCPVQDACAYFAAIPSEYPRAHGRQAASRGRRST